MKCVLAVSACALFTGVGVQAQSDTEAMLILNQNGTDAGDSQLILLSGPNDATIKALDELETRIVLMPPGKGDMLPASATAVISITQPGSYVLGGNLYGVSGKHGIEILKSNVTLDLNGYALIGLPGSKGGIDAPSGIVNIKIHNGAIRGWKQRGIGGRLMTASEISDVRVGNCSWNGIHLGQGIVRNCSSRQNGNHGIQVEHGKSVIELCAVELNAGNGVLVGDSTSISNVSATGNLGHGMACGDQCAMSGCLVSGSGVHGILVGADCTLTGCSSSDNDFVGIVLRGGCIAVVCSASGNDGYGIFIEGNGGVLESCTARSNKFAGMGGDSGVTLTNCASVSNDTDGFAFRHDITFTGCSAFGNGDVGIQAVTGAVIEACVSEDNQTGGISVSSASRISGCVARNHFASESFGIRTTGDTLISGNTCDKNYYNILVIGSKSRVDGNNVTGGTFGIWCHDTGNIIIRNTASSAAGYSIVVGNKVGAFSTNPTSAGPWDNFNY